MTISSAVRIAGPFTGDGINATFPFTYKVFSAADVQVIRLTISTGVETTLTIVTDYNITLNGNQNSNPGGSIVLVTPLLALYTLTATSNIANLQPTDLTNQGGFYPEVITDALDRATIQIQQMSDDVTRSIKAPLSDDLTTMDMTLPVVAERQGKYLVFDSFGSPVVSSGTGSDSALRTDLANATAVSAGSRLSGFRQTGTGAVARTVDAKLKDTFNIMDYAQGSWVPNDITKDFTPTFAAAIDAVAAAGGGVLEFVGSKTYYFLTRPPEITGGVCLSGNFARIRKRYIETGTGTYAGAEGTKRGVFSFLGNTNNFTFIENFTFQNEAWDGADNTGNGSAISIVADVGNTFGPGLIWIRNIHCSADATGLPSPANYIWWKSCIYLDGSEVRSAPIGIRGVYINNCELFTPATAAIEAYGIEHLFVSNTESNVGRTGCCGVKIDGGLKSGGVGAETDRPTFSNCDFQSVFGFKIGTESSVTHSYVQSPIVTGTIGQLELGAQAITPLLVGSQTNTLTIDPSVLYTLITENGCALNGTTTVNGSLTVSGAVTAQGGIVSASLTSKIQPISASVASNALTVTLLPTNLDFRSTTLGSGVITTVVVPSTISIVCPSTATLGTTNAVQSRIAVVAINNAGTVELALVNMTGGSELDETGLISTTAIAAASNSATLYYSTTARASVAYRLVGYVESTQATAGTWATAPSTVQGVGGQAFSNTSSLGYGQTFQSPTRVSGTTYYNTTGKPIFANIDFNATTAPLLIIGGVTATLTGVGTTENISFIVPSYMSYSFTAASGINDWYELR